MSRYEYHVGSLHPINHVLHAYSLAHLLVYSYIPKAFLDILISFYRRKTC